MITNTEEIILMSLFCSFSDNLALCVYACAQMKFACQLLLCSSTCSISWFTLEMDFLIREPFSSSLTFAYCPPWAKLGSIGDIFYWFSSIVVGSLASEFLGWSWKTYVGIPMLDIGIPTSEFQCPMKVFQRGFSHSCPDFCLI